jgi:hypothetical protein
MQRHAAPKKMRVAGDDRIFRAGLELSPGLADPDVPVVTADGVCQRLIRSFDRGSATVAQAR